MTETSGDMDESETRRLMTERGRAVDQLKRLYAVMVGFAVTLGVSSAYLAGRASLRDLESIAVLSAQILTLLSIVIPYYLVAEKHLEDKYVTNLAEPIAWSLMFDVVAMMIPAMLFILLATAIPGREIISLCRADSFRCEYAIWTSQNAFWVIVAAIHILDMAVMGFGLLTRAHGTIPSPKSLDIEQYIRNSIVLDAICLGVTGFALYKVHVFWIPATLWYSVAIAAVHLAKLPIEFSVNVGMLFPFKDRRVRPLLDLRTGRANS